MTKNKKILTGAGIFAVLTLIAVATFYSSGTLFKGALPTPSNPLLQCKVTPNQYVGETIQWQCGPDNYTLNPGDKYVWKMEGNDIHNPIAENQTSGDGKFKWVFPEQSAAQVYIALMNDQDVVIQDRLLNPMNVKNHIIEGGCISPINPLTNTDLTWGAKITGIQNPGTEQYSWLLLNETTQVPVKKESLKSTITHNYPNADPISAKVIVEDMDTHETRLFECPQIQLTSNQPPAADCTVSDAAPQVGDSVTWNLINQQGSGNYSYNWTITDTNVPSHYTANPTIIPYTDTLNEPLNLKASVVITDNTTSQTYTATCDDVVVGPAILPAMELACVLLPDEIERVKGEVQEWIAEPNTQGTQPVSYEWEFKDHLGNIIPDLSNETDYDVNYQNLDPIQISAKVRGIDAQNNYSAYADCHDIRFVNSKPFDDVTATCTVDPASAALASGQQGEWKSAVTGGSGVFKYEWIFADNSETPPAESFFQTPNVKTAFSNQSGSPATVEAYYNLQDLSNGLLYKISCPDVTVSASSQPQPLTVGCVSDKYVAAVGTPITFTANVSGGNAPYTYNWTGLSNLITVPTPPNTVSVQGTSAQPISNVLGHVTVTDANGEIKLANCEPVSFTPTQPPTNDVTCSVSPTSTQTGNIVTWQATWAGAGTPTYSWTGANLNGSTDDNPSMVYNTAGTYTGTVTAKLGAQTFTDTCSVTITAASAGGSGGSSGGTAGGSALNPTKKPSISSVSVDLDPFNPRREVQDMYMNLSNVSSNVTYTFEIYKSTDTKNRIMAWTDTTNISGYQSESWDGKDEDGDFVSDGEYVLRATAREPKSNYTLPAKTVRFDIESSEDLVPEDERCEGYVDVKASDPFCDDIKFANEYMQGYNNYFMSGLAIQRDQSAKVILLVNDLFEEGEKYCTRPPYIDVPFGEWFSEMVCRGSQLGIITGYLGPPDAGYFRPARAVTRVEFLALLQRSLKIPEKAGFSYDDVPTSGVWFTEQGNFARDYNLFPGNNLFPNSDITRGEVARILNKINQAGLF